MFQQIAALLIISFFYFRAVRQRSDQKISHNEFVFWSIFWLITALLVIFIKRIDFLVKSLGFSASGIEALIYLSILIIFHLIFRLRMRLEKMEKEMTKITRANALNKDK